MKIDLQMRRSAGQTDPRRSEPVTFGVPLPQGSARDESEWQLTSSGRTVPVQARVLDRWHDGSARWLLIDAQVDAAGGPSDNFTLEFATSGLVTPALLVKEEAHGIVVDTSSARFTVCIGSTFPFVSVETGGRQVLAEGASGLFVTDSTGKERPAEITHASVAERGALRCMVLIKGIARVGDTDRRLNLTARLHFFAGLPTVRVLVTLTNPERATHPGNFWDLGDPGSALLKDVSVRLAGRSSVSQVHYSAEIGGPVSTVEAPLTLYQDSSGGEYWQSTNHLNRERRVPVTFRGYRISAAGREETGDRATPVVRLEPSGIAATMPHFWENFPKAIEAGGSTLSIGLFPGQHADLHELQGGEQKTHECFLSFGPDEVTAHPLDWCRSRLVPCLNPEWVMASGAVPFLWPLGPEHASLVHAAVEGPDTFWNKREVVDQYGWRHFGEIYGDHESIRQKSPPLVSHYNNQYDPVAGFGNQFLRTGEPAWFVMMEQLARHVTDIDTYHTDRDKSAYNHGMFWHTYHYGDADIATHRTHPSVARGRTHGGGPSADHNYPSGLMLHYFMTGDDLSRESAVSLGQYVVDLDDGALTVFRWLDRGYTGWASASGSYTGPGRGPANSVNALVDACRLTGERRFLVKAEQLIQRVVHPQEDIMVHRLDDPEARWFYLMFLQSLGKYLNFKVERHEVDAAYGYGRDCLLHYARWMAANEYPYLDKPEKLEFPTETWAAQDIRKSDVLHYASMHTDGEERRTFIERARYFHSTSTATLMGMPTRTLARPVIVLLTSGFMDSWRTAHPEISAPAPASQQNYEPRTAFVPQKARAKKRALGMVVAAAAISFVMLWSMIWG